MTEQEFLKLYEEKESELKYKKRKLDTTESHLNNLQNLLADQSAVLRKEQADVYGLDKLSIKNLFNKITSRMDNIIKKEEQEYFDAKVKYEELQNSVYLTEKSAREMKSDIMSIERELRNLKESGRRQFAEIDNKFTAAENEMIRLKSEIKELDEAIESGNRVISAIKKAVRKLEKASGWATYDMFTKGGIISHMAKYGNIDEAQETIKEISYLVGIFQSELKDVNIAFHTSSDNYNGTTRFVDFFFDNIFTDMNVRGKINEDINQLNNLANKVSAIINKLNISKKSILKSISD